MAIELTNPMSGDMFKAEVENALDKRGDAMEGDLQLNTGIIKDLNGVEAIGLDNENKKLRLYGSNINVQPYCGSFNINLSDAISGLIEVDMPEDYNSGRVLLSWDRTFTQDNGTQTTQNEQAIVFITKNKLTNIFICKNYYSNRGGTFSEVCFGNFSTYSVLARNSNIQDLYLQDKKICFSVNSSAAKLITVNYELY